MGILLERFEETVRRDPDGMALWSRGEGARQTFAQLRDNAHRLARAAALPSDRPIGLALPNGSGFLEAFFALRVLGHPVALLDAGLRAPERDAICVRLGIAGVLHEGTDGDPVAGAIRFSPLPRTEGPALPSATALIKITSGSTGEPAGACFTEEALVRGIEQIAEGMDVTARDRVLIAIPLSHSYGFDNGVLSLALIGTPLVIASSYYPAAIFEALAEAEASFFPAVPPLVRPLAGVSWPASALRRVICAGGPLDPADARAFAAASGKPIHQFYGATECGGIAFESHPEEPGAEGTVGRPLPGVTVDLDPEDGRVRVVSHANYCGYVGEPGAVGAPGRPCTVVTGDSAEWAADGRLRLTGRTAEMLNVGGRKLSASRLEQALREIPGIREAAVVGLEDPARGDRIVAFVVADRTIGFPEASGLGVREVRRIEALPYTERGKLDRRRLKDLAARPVSG